MCCDDCDCLLRAGEAKVVRARTGALLQVCPSCYQRRQPPSRLGLHRTIRASVEARIPAGISLRAATAVASNRRILSIQ